jgi:hypothetical protein
MNTHSSITAILRAIHRPLLAALVFTTGAALAQAQIPYEARVDSVHTFMRGSGYGANYYGAVERLRYDSSRAEGIAMFAQLTKLPTSEIVDRFRFTAAWLFCKDALPDTLAARVAIGWKYLPAQPPMNEVERVCHHVSFLLMAEHCPPGQEWYNGRSTAANLAASKAFLLAWMKETTELGQQDFDSPTYGPLFIDAMLLVHRFSRDADLKKRAEVMTTWLLADYLHEYFGGMMGGAHAREEMGSAMQPVLSEFSALAWLYFGDGLQVYSREQYIASRCDYRPPKEIMSLALDKLKPFEAWETKRSATRVRGDVARTRPVQKYTYFDPLFVMGHLERGLVQPREQHTWDVTWAGEEPGTSLFTMQPYAEADGLAEFFPHQPEKVNRGISTLDPYYGTVTKTVGGSPYEDVFQYRNTAIALYNIPDIRRFKAMIAFLPRDVASFDVDSMRTGWITINTGDVYLAYFPLRRATVRLETLGRRLYSSDGRNGAIVQAASRNVVGAYDEFKKRILATMPDTSQYSSKGIIRYTTMFKDRLECAFGGALKVNGKPFKGKPDMLFDSPWITSKRGSGRMTVTTPQGTLVIDMPSATMRSGLQ